MRHTLIIVKKDQYKEKQNITGLNCYKMQIEIQDVGFFNALNFEAGNFKDGKKVGLHKSITVTYPPQREMLDELKDLMNEKIQKIRKSSSQRHEVVTIDYTDNTILLVESEGNPRYCGHRSSMDEAPKQFRNPLHPDCYKPVSNFINFIEAQASKQGFVHYIPKNTSYDIQKVLMTIQLKNLNDRIKQSRQNEFLGLHAEDINQIKLKADKLVDALKIKTEGGNPVDAVEKSHYTICKIYEALKDENIAFESKDILLVRKENPAISNLIPVLEEKKEMEENPIPQQQDEDDHQSISTQSVMHIQKNTELVNAIVLNQYNKNQHTIKALANAVKAKIRYAYSVGDNTVEMSKDQCGVQFGPYPSDQDYLGHGKVLEISYVKHILGNYERSEY